MRAMGTWSENVSHQWQYLLYPSGVAATDKAWEVACLYGVRGMALLAGAAVWVALILGTGMFSVAPVILIGFAIGNAHRLLPFKFHRAHLPSTTYITLIGGLLANVFAGLAEFSSTMGVSYTMVLSARRIPEELPMLGNAFVEAFRVQDGFYYALAMLTAVWCALRHRKVPLKS